MKEIIIQIIEEVAALHPYKVVGKHETYNDYNQGWEDACNAIAGKIEDTAINMDTDTATEKTREIIQDWVEVRKHNDLVGLQDIRDRMSEHLVWLGHMESKYASEMMLGKGELERCIDEFKQSVRESGVKIGVDELDTRARNNCRAIITKQIHAEITFKWYNRLIKRCDQVLNTTSSAVKIIMKAL